MLILQRKRSEIICLFKDGQLVGEVSLQQIRGNNVRLGFEFPEDFVIKRKELVDPSNQESKKSS